MRPILLRHTALEMCRHVVDVSLELAVQCRAEAATISPSLSHRPHHHLRVWACLTTMSGFVVLIERVGTPKTLVAAVTGVFARAVVEFLLVSLPIELALEGLIAGSAPELGLARGVRHGGDGAAR